MTYAIAKGVFDIVPSAPEPWKDSALWQQIEHACRDAARLFGFREMRTPAFERTELFARSVGENTDIVGKEMYTFKDRAGRSMTLRPEGTAPIVRALLTRGLQGAGLEKIYYLGPMWRYERQQAGRYRQHHQFGAEVIGDPAPERDAELIDLLITLFDQLGLRNLTLMINSIGDPPCRLAYRAALQRFLTPKASTLSEESQRRLTTNPLRILDSKDRADQLALEGGPVLEDFLSSECHEHFQAVKQALTAMNISFEVNPRLVRGLDYYSRTVFEITAGELGAQNSLGGGGRYNDLIEQLGGPALPALGFGAGLERILQTMVAQGAAPPPPAHVKILLVPMGEAARARCFCLLKELRSANIASEIELTGRKLKSVLRSADNQDIPFVAVIGDDELQSGTCALKEMRTHTSNTVKLEDLTCHV